jgi:hypothetical protein
LKEIILNFKVNGDETVEADEAVENQDEEVAENVAEAGDDVAEVVDEVAEAEVVDDVNEAEVNSVKEILNDVMEVVSAVADVDGHPEEVDLNANVEESQAAGSGEAEVSIKIVKTGQIMIEETDLGDDECIRTEYEIEEVEISQ